MSELADHLEVVDSTGWGSNLEVVVRDQRDGQDYRVQFKENLMGEYKHSGGGGYHPSRKKVFNAAERVAAHYVRKALGHDVLAKDEWTLVKPTTAAKILEDSPDYTVERVEDGDGE